jgi:hypothetical protein
LFPHFGDLFDAIHQFFNVVNAVVQDVLMVKGKLYALYTARNLTDLPGTSFLKARLHGRFLL